MSASHVPGLCARFWQYQRERFPLHQHAPLIAVFTFSAASYSRICRGAPGLVPMRELIVGAITSIGLFLLLRIFDEFKDAEEDALYRPYRPVPRGLISLEELRRIGIGVVVVQIALNAIVMPRMLAPYALVIGYMLLMGKEFFVRDWLKRRPIIYMLSHMVVLPAIDFYTTGLDWINVRAAAPVGLQFFLAVTFLNGIVIEVGRKIRARDMEEHGVETYSALYGARPATVLWMAVLALTCITAAMAAEYARMSTTVFAVLTAAFILSALPAFMFLRTGRAADAKRIEIVAGIWTIAMYLTLGAGPVMVR